MEEMKIKGFKIIITRDSILIQDSYKLSNINKMKDILKEILTNTTEYNTKRSLKSLIREWVSHNLLYKIHFFRKHTKDVNLEKNINIILKIGYFLISFFSIIKYILLQKFFILKTKIQEKRYKKYLKKHKKYIIKAYENFISNPNSYLIADKELLDKLYERILIHDNSKFSDKEFDGYRKHFFPASKQEKEESLEDYKKALDHHYKTNSHHWQNRQTKKDFDICNDEEILDILENILDWMAIGYFFKNTVKEYYDKNKKDIILCKEEKIYLEHIIYDILEEKGDLKWKKRKKKKLQ